MSVKLKTKAAPGGVLLNAITRGFKFSPEGLSPGHGTGRNVRGHGHMHLYVDGKMATLLVGPWLYVSLDKGRHTLRVTFNANDHSEYGRHGKAVGASTRVSVK